MVGAAMAAGRHGDDVVSDDERTIEPAAVDVVAIAADRASRLLARSEQAPAAIAMVRAALDSVAPSSRHTLSSRLDGIARACGLNRAGDVPWDALTPEVTTWIRGRLVDDYEATTANAMLSALRSVLHQGWRLGVWSHDEHARLADLPAVAGWRRPAGRLLSPLDVEKLRAAAGDGARGARDRAAIALVVGAGLRRSEACDALREKYDETGVRIIGKGNRERLVPLPSWARRDLDAWLVVRGDLPGVVLHPVGKGGRIERRRISSTGLYLALADLTDRAGVTPWAPHSGRRTFASALLDAGADLSTVAGVLGHASTDTTRRYDLRGDAARAGAVARLDRWVSER